MWLVCLLHDSTDDVYFALLPSSDCCTFIEFNKPQLSCKCGCAPKHKFRGHIHFRRLRLPYESHKCMHTKRRFFFHFLSEFIVIFNKIKYTKMMYQVERGSPLAIDILLSKSFRRNYVRRNYAMKTMRSIYGAAGKGIDANISIGDRTECGNSCESDNCNGNCTTEQNFIFSVTIFCFFFCAPNNSCANNSCNDIAIDKKSNFLFNFTVFITLECMV